MCTIELAVIGAGASGVAAAVAYHESLHRHGRKWRTESFMLFERNRRIAEKIRISGGGKCNLTHEGPVSQLLEEGFLEPSERRFLRHAIHTYTNTDVMRMMESEGVRLGVRPDGKVFTAEGDADAVATAFETMLRNRGIRVEYEARVERVRYVDGLFEIDLPSGPIRSKRLVIAAGGASWPQLGTTADGLRLAVSLGHRKTPYAPALAPVYLKEHPGSALSGLALRSVALHAVSGKRKAVRRGDLLFTHRGLSGPAVLSISREVFATMEETGSCTLAADLFPSHDPDGLEAELLRHAARHGSQHVRKFLQSCPIAPSGSIAGESAERGTIPTALVPHILRHAGITGDPVWGGLQKKCRLALLGVLKRFPLGEAEKVPLEQGEVTAGGVVLREVDPRTMESRVLPGLYLVGEVLDYAGEIGGYNLQAAFSTGWLAGRAAAQSAQE